MVVALLLLPTLALAGLSGTASAQDTSDVRVIHGIPDVDVDVYVDGTLALPGFEFSDSADLVLEAATYQIDIYPAGADPTEVDPIIADAVELPGGISASLIANLAADGAPQLTVFVDDRSAIAADEGRVTVRHTAAAPAVNLLVDGTAVATGVVNGEEFSADLLEDSYDFAVQVAPDGPIVLELDNTLVEAQTALTVYAVGDATAEPSTLTVLVFADPLALDGSFVTVLHGIPGVDVDVYLDGMLAIPGFEPETTAGPLPLTAGNYQITVYLEGADPNVATPVIDQEVSVPTGELDISLIANLSDEGTPQLTAFVDDLSPVAAGTARIVVRHTAEAPPVNILVNGEPFGAVIANGEQITADIPAGTYELAVQVAPDGPVVIDLGEVSVAGGQLLTAYAIGSAVAEPATLTVWVLSGDLVQNPFPDVPEGSQFFTEITWMVTNGITTGFADGTFRPTVAVSRQATAAFLYRYAGFPDGLFPTCDVAPFSDVPVDSPFCGEITWMVDQGIATGFPDDTFKPTDAVSRQAAAAFLARFADTPIDACDAAPFSDVPADSTFCGEIAWMVDLELTTGFADGTFRPTIPVSRQAMAAFLYRYDQTLEPVG
ncbi:MAG: DUF4397 domain-containing protein [Acidimicrobiia bacterium]|nr:DUF4397 domain-containing protein [Acidimicrobiia bacterium]